MKERPTRRDYIEILSCRAIILHLEDSRSHGKEAEADQDSFSWEISTDLKDQE